MATRYMLIEKPPIQEILLQLTVRFILEVSSTRGGKEYDAGDSR